MPPDARPLQAGHSRATPAVARPEQSQGTPALAPLAGAQAKQAATSLDESRAAPAVAPLDQSRSTLAVSHLSELTAALHEESRIVEELTDALIEQRGAVARNDAAAVHASVDTIAKTLLTLEQARARRGRIMTSLAGTDALPCDQLERVLGRILPSDLEEARDRLRRSALRVAQEVRMYRDVLRRAEETGEAFLQALFSLTVDPTPVYRPDDRREETPTGAGLLLNRVA